MINEFNELMQQIQIEQTPTGKLLIILDTVGVSLSVGYYGFNMAEKIDAYAPPFILVLTVLSLLLSIAYKSAYEYRQCRKRKTEKTAIVDAINEAATAKVAEIVAEAVAEAIEAVEAEKKDA